jgi:hypothetical protein
MVAGTGRMRDVTGDCDFRHRMLGNRLHGRPNGRAKLDE